MSLPYTAETLASPDGIACRVLDSTNVDFSAAVMGRKSAETLVRCAKGGEFIQTKNAKGEIETEYTAQKGDAIFVNLHNMDDIYVPGNGDGTRWQFSALSAKGYIVVAQEDALGGTRVKNGASFRILHEAVQEPSCIKDAWGQGQHQFFFKGATLKLNDDGRVTAIDKSAFDATWEIAQPAPKKPALKSPRF